ncbi:MAG TPA: metallophosphoesterase [Pyrinomonadaceae bacterium]|nr:metallophosphoesterase [Pyrinomonadaceae bacterium]
MRRNFLLTLLISAILLIPASAQRLTLPVKDGSVRFAVIGDTGSGSDKQREVGEMMAQYRAVYPFEFVLMMGDNLYGGEAPKDFEKKFSEPYKALLDNKVKFYATLGNHDQALQVNYANFNMNGKEYYRFKKGNVAFYSLNSNYMDKKQVEWLESELSKDTSDWKVCFFHHPPYSSAKKHGSDPQLREVVEPIFIKYGVNVVLTGHDHVYERIKPQKGIYYFVSGAGGQLRAGDVKETSALVEKSYDRDNHFMLFEVAGDQMYFQAISRTGETIDSGVIARVKH